MQPDRVEHLEEVVLNMVAQALTDWEYLKPQPVE